MLVPVWAATWEIECCQPEAEVGKEWKVPVIFRPSLEPPWVTAHRAKATKGQRRLGVVRLDATSGDVDEELGQQLMTSGPISFRAGADLRAGSIEGRLYLDAHVDAPRFGGRDEVRGIVERVQLVPLRYVEVADKYFVPAEQLDAIEATSTAARDGVARRREGGHVQIESLVWLRVGSSLPGEDVVMGGRRDAAVPGPRSRLGKLARFRVGVGGWGLVVLGTPLMVFIARRPRS